MRASKSGLLTLLSLSVTVSLAATGCGAGPSDGFDDWSEETSDSIAEQSDALMLKSMNYQPDLAIEIETEATCTWGTGNVIFWVRNLDRGYAAPSVVAYRYGPAGSTYLTRNSYVSVPGIRPYGRELVEVSIRHQPRVRVTADAFDGLAESDESNNTEYLDCDRFLQVPDLELQMY